MSMMVSAVITEGPRVVAAAQSVGIPPAVLQQTTTAVLPSPMSAGGTPIILAAPRLQTPAPTPQLAGGITSLPNQAAVLAGGAHHTPSMVTPANAAATVPTSGLVYSYDPSPYLQRMLEYSTSVEPSAIGKCLSAYFH